MNWNPDLPNHDSKEIFQSAGIYMASELSKILHSPVTLSDSSNFEIKRSNESNVAKLDFITTFDLAACNPDELIKNFEQLFTNDDFQQKIYFDLLIAKKLNEVLSSDLDLVREYRISDVSQYFSELFNLGLPEKAIVDFFVDSNDGLTISKGFLSMIASGNYPYSMSFACKATDVSRSNELINEINMYRLFSEGNIRTFCAYGYVLEDENSGRCFDLTVWRTNMLLHVHNRNLFSASSDILARTISTLLKINNSFSIDDINLRNIGIDTNDFNYEETVLFFDLVTASPIGEFENGLGKIYPGVINFCNSMLSLFNFMFINNEITISDADHTIAVMNGYKKGLEYLATSKHGSDSGKEEFLELLLEEVDKFISHIRYLITQR